MKNPDLIPIYAHLLCNEAISEAVDDAAHHLFLRAVAAGLLRSDEAFDGHGSNPEPMMARLLEVSTASADMDICTLAARLEALLRQEFRTRITRH